MKFILFLCLPLFLSAKTSFITQMEYAQQLYKNPRGIGCEHCHGKNGEGKIVAEYTHKKVKKTFGGSKINKLSFDSFYKALNSPNNGMPRYYLTKKEVKTLYFYLHRDEKKKEKKDAK